MPNRRTPTPANYGASIPDSEYAGDVDLEIGRLYEMGLDVLGSVAGVNTLTATCSPTLAAYVRKCFLLKPANANTGAVTLNVDGLGAKDFNDQSGDPLIAGDLDPARTYLIYDAGADFRMAFTVPVSAVEALPRHYMSGDWLTANNGSDANNDIDFTAGAGRDSADTRNLIGPAMTKRLDAVWAAGHNNGGMLQSANLAGTISVTNSGTSVTGSSTAFSTNFQVGDVIQTAGGQARRITAIGSDTSITVTPAWSGTESGVTYKRGGKAPSTVYRLFAIYKDSDGSVDYAASPRDVPADMPSGYTPYRRIWYVLTDGSANNRPYRQIGNRCVLLAPILDINGTNTASISATVTSAAPPGVIADFSLSLVSSNATDQSVVSGGMKVCSTYQTAASVHDQVFARMGRVQDFTGAVIQIPGEGFARVDVHLDANSQFTHVKAALNGTSQINTYQVALNGWLDQR
jgi:hypothetical protein